MHLDVLWMKWIAKKCTNPFFQSRIQVIKNLSWKVTSQLDQVSFRQEVLINLSKYLFYCGFCSRVSNVGQATIGDSVFLWVEFLHIKPEASKIKEFKSKVSVDAFHLTVQLFRYNFTFLACGMCVAGPLGRHRCISLELIELSNTNKVRFIIYDLFCRCIKNEAHDERFRKWSVVFKEFIII